MPHGGYSSTRAGTVKCQHIAEEKRLFLDRSGAQAASQADTHGRGRRQMDLAPDPDGLLVPALAPERVGVHPRRLHEDILSVVLGLAQVHREREPLLLDQP